VTRNYRSKVFLLAGLLFALTLAGCGTGTSTEDLESSAETLSSAEEHFIQGNELSQAGDFAQAAIEYGQALELDPDNVDVMTNLGVAYYNLGQLDRAIEQYTEAIKIAPNDADIRSNLAAAYVQKHQMGGESDQLDKALEEYQKAVELNPSLAQAFFGLGVVHVLLGQNDDAIKAFERFQELDTGQDPMATSNAEEYLRQLRGQ
jgi:tetratricopeptide (TPR) repeat protein